MSEPVYLTEYRYTGLTGNIYHPYYYDGKWYLVPGISVGFLDMAALCGIDDAEVLSFLRLKYGG